MRKLIRFCMVIVLVMIIGAVLLVAALRYSPKSEEIRAFLTEKTGGKIDEWLEDVEGLETSGKELFADLKENGDEILSDVLDKYSDLEGFDIEDAIIFDKEELVEEGDIERIYENLNASALNVEISGCVMEIRYSEDANVRIVTENVGKFQAYQKGNELRVLSTRKAKEDAEDSRITLYLPVGYHWKKVNLELGAGAITVEGLLVSELEASVSMGNLELKLAGSQKEYDFELECMAGNIAIGQEQYGGAVKEQKINNSAERSVDLACSMGNINVTFEQ